MTTDIIPTGVDGISAQHLSLQQTDWTLVWCPPDDERDGAPLLWDATGCGDWRVYGDQPVAHLYRGHLHGAALVAAARSVRAAASARFDRERAARLRLMTARSSSPSLSSLTDVVAAQLASELGSITAPVVELVGAPDIRPSIAAAAPLLASRLQAGDPRTCARLLGALWPHGAPETVGRADWWRTPLGRVCAGILAHDDDTIVTYAVAAEMLGVHRGTVAQLAHRGTLHRCGGRGVLRASVLRRLSGP